MMVRNNGCVECNFSTCTNVTEVVCFLSSLLLGGSGAGSNTK